MHMTHEFLRTLAVVLGVSYGIYRVVRAIVLSTKAAHARRVPAQVVDSARSRKSPDASSKASGST